jgi:hypothetical protein
MVWRVPIVKANVPAAASSTHQRVAVRLSDTVVCLFITVSLRRFCEQHQRLINQRMQGQHAWHAQAGIEPGLRRFPVPLRILALLPAGWCHGDQSAATIGTASSCAQPVQQGLDWSQVEVLPSSPAPVTRRMGPSLTMRQQRVLSRLEPGLRQLNVIEL